MQKRFRMRRPVSPCPGSPRQDVIRAANSIAVMLPNRVSPRNPLATTSRWRIACGNHIFNSEVSQERVPDVVCLVPGALSNGNRCTTVFHPCCLLTPWKFETSDFGC